MYVLTVKYILMECCVNEDTSTLFRLFILGSSNVMAVLIKMLRLYLKSRMILIEASCRS